MAAKLRISSKNIDRQNEVRLGLIKVFLSKVRRSDARCLRKEAREIGIIVKTKAICLNSSFRLSSIVKEDADKEK